VALLGKPLLEPAKPARVNLANYDEVLQRAEQQRTLAREMTARARQMIDSALSMKNKVCLFVLP
jgi:hypothetical protein